MHFGKYIEAGQTYKICFICLIALIQAKIIVSWTGIMSGQILKIEEIEFTDNFC